VLAKKSFNGDEDSINKLVKSNLRFVVSVAKHYASTNNPLSDLINEGNIGLIKAAQKFDPDNKNKKGNKIKFISYAVWWIRKVIMEHLSNNGRMVRLPANKISSLSKLDKKVNELEQRECRNIDIKEVIAEFDGIISNDNLELLNVLNTYSMDSLDRQIGDDEGSSALGDLISGEGYDDTDHLVNKLDVKLEVERLLKTLKDREKRIIIAYYGLDGNSPMTLAEIGRLEDINVTREMVRQIKAKVLIKLKAKLVNSELKEHFNF